MQSLNASNRIDSFPEWSSTRTSSLPGCNAVTSVSLSGNSVEKFSVLVAKFNPMGSASFLPIFYLIMLKSDEMMF